MGKNQQSHQTRAGPLCDSSLLDIVVLSRVQLFATPWSIAHRASLSMGFFRQEYWSG